jgi:uncharacterized protein (DUF433 family)
MKSAVITVNKNIQGGTPCFAGTRVPVSSLFDYLEGGYSTDEFLTQFPTVSRQQVTALLEDAKARIERESVGTAG